MQSYDATTAIRRGWPAKALAFNPLNGTSGLRDLYAELQVHPSCISLIIVHCDS